VEQLHDTEGRGFASDNYAGTHPEVLAALAVANGGHAPAYGEDPYTEALRVKFRDMLGAQTLVYPVFNGTGANVVGIQSLLTRWGGVIAPAIAHVNTDEGGAPEKVGGFKIIPVATPDARPRTSWGSRCMSMAPASRTRSPRSASRCRRRSPASMC
jgi:threonine aldolase